MSRGPSALGAAWGWESDLIQSGILRVSQEQTCLALVFHDSVELFGIFLISD